MEYSWRTFLCTLMAINYLACSCGSRFPQLPDTDARWGAHTWCCVFLLEHTCCCGFLGPSSKELVKGRTSNVEVWMPNTHRETLIWSFSPHLNSPVLSIACRALVDEMEWAISKVDPKKTVQTGSFRINPDGSQSIREVRLHRLIALLTLPNLKSSLVSQLGMYYYGLSL
jgi:hypothetical protein